MIAREEDETSDEVLFIERINKIMRIRRIRTTSGAFLVSTSLLFMQLSVLILLGIVAVSAIVAVVLIILAPIIMAFGLYLLLHSPPIVLEE